ncbi:VPRBP family protein [Megaselia abdita]
MSSENNDAMEEENNSAEEAELAGYENEDDVEIADGEDVAQEDDDSSTTTTDADEPEVEETPPPIEECNMPQVLTIWEKNNTTPGYDPVPLLKRLCEIFEVEQEIYMRKDPDPFDERHPYRSDPSLQYGFLLKQLFKKDYFMTKVVNDYLRENYFTRQNIQKSSLELNILACRLILVIMPGLETAAVFLPEHDQLINRIFGWAEDSIEPLQSYATGLLAAAMEVTEIAVAFREPNIRLIPKMLKRLYMLQAIQKSKTLEVPTPTASTSSEEVTKLVRNVPDWMSSAPASPAKSESTAHTNHVPNGHATELFATASNMSTFSNYENSRDGTNTSTAFRLKRIYIPVHPPTAESSQMLILRYLTSMGEYQEFLGMVFEHKAMQLIIGYIDNLDPKDTCLAFEALKYLASLLCHKKFALEFVSSGGLDYLLKVPRPNIAATGVSITLYYLAYCEDAMERICAMPKEKIQELVKYALWLLGRSYDSGKCHATMFFGLSFQFKVILDEFDNQDGLRKLYNVISILPILNPDNDDVPLDRFTEDMECSARQLVRHVCVALKRYMESHLYFKYHTFMRNQLMGSPDSPIGVVKAVKPNLDQVSEQVRTLQENLSARVHWGPVDQLMKHSGISLLLKIIAFSYEWNNTGRAETVRSALDVISICCVVPKVYLTLCEKQKMPDQTTYGINSILGAAVGEIVTDAEVQKSALAVLVHCVCAPILRPISRHNISTQPYGINSTKKKILHKLSEEILEKIWEACCSNNGIIVLLQLMQTKTPITDADCIRGMACRALAGLARSERVRQIIGKLPLFTSGQLQILIRDPILQEKRTEHVLFQKYALELLERVMGKTKSAINQLDSSLANIHKANVVAQTKIQYNEQQLYQLIYNYLDSKGLSSTAQTLQKEAGLNTATPSQRNIYQSPYDYKILPTSNHVRQRLRARGQEISSALSALPGPHDLDSSMSEHPANTPIKLIKKTTGCQPSTSNTTINGPASSHSLNSISSGTMLAPPNPQSKLQKQLDACGSPMPSSRQNVNSQISLDTIVTEYLTNQHALCNNPMTTCPQFDLFKPHKCPDPKPFRSFDMDNNLVMRIMRGQTGYSTTKLDRRFVHQHFCPHRVIKAADFAELQFTCCHLLPINNIIVVGSYHGEAKAFNVNDGSELFSSNVHNSFIDHISSNRAGNLVLTSCSWRSPLSGLWDISQNDFINKANYIDEFYCEFSNLSQDKILGTKTDACTVFDIETSEKVSVFAPNIPNQYTKNRATFCPTDELILSATVINNSLHTLVTFLINYS